MSQMKKKYEESRKECEKLRNYVAKIEDENEQLRNQMAEIKVENERLKKKLAEENKGKMEEVNNTVLEETKLAKTEENCISCEELKRENETLKKENRKLQEQIKRFKQTKNNKMANNKPVVDGRNVSAGRHQSRSVDGGSDYWKKNGNVSDVYLPRLQNRIAFLPLLDGTKLKGLIRGQIEYYFSEGNLQKNFFLQREMDMDGFLPLELIANFPPARNLTIDHEFIIDCLRDSEKIELCKDQQKIRPRKYPLQWSIKAENWPRIGEEDIKHPNEIQQHQNALENDKNSKDGNEVMKKKEEEGEQKLEANSEENIYDYNQTAEDLQNNVFADQFSQIKIDKSGNNGIGGTNENGTYAAIASFIVPSHCPRVISESEQKRESGASPPTNLTPESENLLQMEKEIEEITNHLAQIKEQRKYYLEQAKNNRLPGSGEYYASKARSLLQKIDSLNGKKYSLETKCDRILLRNTHNEMVLDLHNLDVERALERAKYKIDLCREKHREWKQIEIITGYGSTTRQPSIIRTRLTQFLKKRGIKWADSPTNRGILYIYLQEIHQRLTDE